MNTGIVRNRWTNKENTLAKEALKKANGNQREAMRLVQGVINRTPASIQVRMSFLAKKHPSLRKSKFKQKTARVVAPQKDTVVITRIEWGTDHVKLYF